MRIAQLVETLGSGGAEKLAVDIAASWAGRGHESHLLALSGDGHLRAGVPAQVRFRDLGLRRGARWDLAGLFSLSRAFGELVSVLRKEGIDVLQTHLPLANFLGLALSWRRVGCRVFPTVHNTREFHYGAGAGPARAALRRAGYRQMLVHCRGMIAVSERVKAAMAGELGLAGTRSERITVVPNGVKIPATLSVPEKLEAKRRLGIGGQEVLLLGIGRLTEQKNFRDLLAALAALPASVPPWRCIIAGEGPLRPDLEARISALGLGRRVTLAGLVTDVGALLGAGDIFCFPSLWEGLPLALLEGMAAGLPVAAYDIDGVGDLVADGREGYLGPPGDQASLASGLSRLLEDPAGRRAMGNAARETVSQQNGWETMMDLLEVACLV